MQNKDMHFSSSCEGALGGRGQVLVLPPPPPHDFCEGALRGGGSIYRGKVQIFYPALPTYYVSA